MERIEANTNRILSLNGKHRGDDIFVIGAGPQLNEISEDAFRLLGNKITIGVNRVQYKLKLTYFISAYIAENLLAKMDQDDLVALHMRKEYVAPLDSRLLTVKRTHFDPAVGLPPEFSSPVPTIHTLRNVTLGATHLALILGAKRIIYLGIEQKNRLHYYNTDQKLKDRIADGLRRIENKDIFNIDHKHCTFDYLMELLHKPPEALNQLDYLYDHRPTYRAYFEILKQRGIAYYTTKKESVLFDSGAPYLPLEAFLS